MLTAGQWLPGGAPGSTDTDSSGITLITEERVGELLPSQGFAPFPESLTVCLARPA